MNWNEMEWNGMKEEKNILPSSAYEYEVLFFSNVHTFPFIFWHRILLLPFLLYKSSEQLIGVFKAKAAAAASGQRGTLDSYSSVCARVCVSVLKSAKEEEMRLNDTAFNDIVRWFIKEVAKQALLDESDMMWMCVVCDRATFSRRSKHSNES